MNPRTTGLLLLLAMLLAAGVYWFEIRGKAEREAEAGRAKLLFGELEAETLTAIDLTTSDGQATRLERRDGAWWLASPVAFPADPTTADALAATLAGMKSESALDDPQAPEVYGLGEAARTIRFAADGSEHVLEVGKSAPVGSRTYVAVGGQAGVYTAESFRTNSLSPDLVGLREKRPVRFDRDAVRSIRIRWQGGGAALARTEDGWRLTDPVTGPADARAVDGLLSDLVYLRAEGFVDDPPPDAETGLDVPVFAVELVAGEGDDAPVHRLAIGGTLASGNRAARGAETALYEIADARLEDFPREVMAYRYKTLSQFVASDAQSFELLFHPQVSSSAGPTIIRGRRQDEGWTTEPERMAPDKPGRMIAELARLDAEAIVADGMGDAELAAVGLSPPRALVRVFGTAPAGGEPPVLAEVALGDVDREGVLARAAGDERVYRLASELGEHLPLGLAAFRNRFLSLEDPETDAAALPADAGVPEAAPEPAQAP